MAPRSQQETGSRHRKNSEQRLSSLHSEKLYIAPSSTYRCPDKRSAQSRVPPVLNRDPGKGAVQQLRQKRGGANQLGAVPQATARQEEAVVSKVGVRCEVLQESEGGCK
jgi:hypothetical protein